MPTQSNISPPAPSAANSDVPVISHTEFGHLRKLLRRRLEVIADHSLRDVDPEGHLFRLREVSEALLSEHARLRPQLPPRLNHFMTQASYSKALEYLESA